MSTVFSLAGRAVFGFVVVQEPHVKVRMMTREWETLCLAEGQTIRMVCSGQVDSTLLIGAVTPAEAGNTWVSFIRPIRAAS